MDLSTMMTKIDLHKYHTVQQFQQDIQLICCNALEYNPDRDPQGLCCTFNFNNNLCGINLAYTVPPIQLIAHIVHLV